MKSAGSSPAAHFGFSTFIKDRSEVIVIRRTIADKKNKLYKHPNSGVYKFFSFLWWLDLYRFINSKNAGTKKTSMNITSWKFFKISKGMNRSILKPPLLVRKKWEYKTSMEARNAVKKRGLTFKNTRFSWKWRLECSPAIKKIRGTNRHFQKTGSHAW